MFDLNKINLNEIIDNGENKDYLNKLFLNYLKEIGFEDSSKILQIEMGLNKENIFSEELKKLFYELEFLQCLDIYKKNYNNYNKKLIIELLLLSFIKEIKNNNKEKYFIFLKNQFIQEKLNFDDINCFTNLLFYNYDYIKNNIFNIENNDNLKTKLLKLENLLLDKDYNSELMRIWKNDYTYNLNNCKYHNDIYKKSEFKEFNIENRHICIPRKIPNKIFLEFEFIKSEINIIKTTKDLKYIALAYMNFTIIILNLIEDENENLDFKILHNKDNIHKKEINDMNFNTTGEFLLSCSSDLSILIIDIETGNITVRVDKAHTDYITGANFINNQNDMVSSGIDGYVKLWKYNGEFIKEFKMKRIKQMIISNDGLYLYLLTGDSKNLIILETLKFTIFDKYISDENIISFEISDDNKFILLNCSMINPKLKLLDLENLKVLKTYKGFNQEKLIMKAKIDSKNNLIFSTSENGEIIVWHINNDKEILGKISQNENLIPVNDISVIDVYNSRYSILLLSVGDNFKLNIYTD